MYVAGLPCELPCAVVAFTRGAVGGLFLLGDSEVVLKPAAT